MDRSSRRNGIVWVWVAASALLLPACSDVASPERDGQASRVSAAVTPAHRAGTVAVAVGFENGDFEDSAPGDAVISLASHRFSPPPLPQVDEESDPTGAAHLLPNFDSSTAADHAPRRLPEIDSLSAHEIESEMSGTSAHDEPTLQLPLPPQADAEHGLTEALIRRLPGVEPEATATADILRRLPPVDPGFAEQREQSDLDPMWVEDAETPADELPENEISVDESPEDALSGVVSEDAPSVDQPLSVVPELEGPSLAPPDQSDPPALVAGEPPWRDVSLAEQPPHHVAGGPWYVPEASEVATEKTEESTALATPESSPVPSMATQFPPASTYQLPGSVPDAGVLPVNEPHDTVPHDTAAPDTAAQQQPVGPSDLTANALDAEQPTAVREALQVWTPVSVPVAPKESAQPLAQPRRDTTLDVISRRVMQHSRKAEDLASRGAYYAARAEMIKALRAITQALDAEQGGKRHSEALARAMRVFQEAGDFAPRGSQLEADLNLTQIVSGHRTTILKDVNLDYLTPLAAQQKYLEYAQEQFAEACDDLPAASYALYGLARIYSVMDHAKVDVQMLCLPKAVTLHQAALLVDASNAKAANELGVLLVQFGQLEDARRVLQHALSISPEPEIWMNVAAVHQRLGELELAQQAHQQGMLMASRQVGGTRTDAGAVKWVDPKTFSAVRPGPGQ